MYVCVTSAVFHSLQPQGLQPARLFGPWNSPGKNSGVGCHALLQQIVPIQGLNLGLSHCRWILHHLSHQGGPHKGEKLIKLKMLFNYLCYQEL